MLYILTNNHKNKITTVKKSLISFNSDLTFVFLLILLIITKIITTVKKSYISLNSDLNLFGMARYPHWNGDVSLRFPLSVLVLLACIYFEKALQPVICNFGNRQEPRTAFLDHWFIVNGNILGVLIFLYILIHIGHSFQWWGIKGIFLKPKLQSKNRPLYDSWHLF